MIAVVLIAFLLCHSVSAVFQYHMFQLNSYRAAGQLHWLRRNLVRGYVGRVWLVALALIPLALLPLPDTACLIAAALFLLQAWLNRPKKAKKPLVYTPRVKRMMASNLLLTAIAVTLILAGIPHPRTQTALLAGLLLLSPLLVLLSNWINAPMERAINNWYIKDAARMIREAPNLTVIGVTGSYGKTSAKYFLHKLLSQKYNVLMTPESYNTTLGVVKTVRTELRPVHDIFICEMGAKGLGEIKEICDIVHPMHGIITSIGPQHLETFGSLENVIQTKFELADALPEGGVSFLNYDNQYIRERNWKGGLRTYGVEGGWDYAGSGIRASETGSHFTVAFPDGELLELDTRLLGAHNVQNIVGCIAVADYLGVSRSDIRIAVRRLESVPHRLQLIQRGKDIIIDDAYNSNTTGAKAALDTLAMFDGFKVLVTPGMIELGKEEERYHRAFGAQAAEACDFVILVGRRQTEHILAGLLDTGFPESQAYVAADLGDAFAKINSLRTKDGQKKVILLENDLPDNY